jgi:hypothetical protein
MKTAPPSPVAQRSRAGARAFAAAKLAALGLRPDELDAYRAIKTNHISAPEAVAHVIAARRRAG